MLMVLNKIYEELIIACIAESIVFELLYVVSAICGVYFVISKKEPKDGSFIKWLVDSRQKIVMLIGCFVAGLVLFFCLYRNSLPIAY